MANATVFERTNFYNPMNRSTCFSPAIIATDGIRLKLPLLLLASFLSLCLSGCATSPQATKPTLEVKTHQPESYELKALQELVERKDFKAAARQLKKIKTSAIPTADSDAFLYLSARISFEQTPKKGCRLLAAYARSGLNPAFREEAIRLALDCLAAPSECALISTLADDAATDFLALVTTAGLKSRLKCPNLHQVTKKLIDHLKDESGEQNHLLSSGLAIIDALPFGLLRTNEPHFSSHTSLHRAAIKRLLMNFGNNLTASETQHFISQFDADDPILSEWRSAKTGTTALFCLPLSGNFKLTGERIRTQLMALKDMNPTPFHTRLDFINCSQEGWSREELTAALEEKSVDILLSLSAPTVQREIRQMVANSPKLLHFTLNPMPAGMKAPHTWSLNVTSDITIGTLATEALRQLSRSASNPLPLRVAVLTQSTGRTNLAEYVQTYRDSFQSLRIFEAPEICSRNAQNRVCRTKTQEKWEEIARQIQNMSSSKFPLDVVFLDVELEQSVSFLKYYTDARTPLSKELISADKQHQLLIFGDHRLLTREEFELVVLDEQGPMKSLGIKNKFTRLAGPYSQDLLFLVPQNLLNSDAIQFNRDARQSLGETPTEEVAMAIDALRMMDSVIQTARRDGKTPRETLKNGLNYAGIYSTLSISPGGGNAARLSILVSRDGTIQLPPSR